MAFTLSGGGAISPDVQVVTVQKSSDVMMSSQVCRRNGCGWPLDAH